MTATVSRKRGSDSLSPASPTEENPAKRQKTEKAEEKAGLVFTTTIANGVETEKSIAVGCMTSDMAPAPVVPFNPQTLSSLVDARDFRTGKLLYGPSLSEQGATAAMPNGAQLAPVSTSAEKANALVQSQLSTATGGGLLRPPPLPGFETWASFLNSLAPAIPFPVFNAPKKDEPDYEEMGLKSLIAGDFPEARSAFERCLQAANFQSRSTDNPNKKMGHVLNHLGLAQLGRLGLALYENGYDFDQFQGALEVDFDQVIQNFEKALNARFEFDLSFRQQVQFNLAVTYYCRNEQGDQQRAVDLLIEALKDVSDDVAYIMPDEDRFFCAKMCWMAGTLLSDPNRALYYFNLGVHCHMQQIGRTRQTVGDPFKGNLFAQLHYSRGIIFKENGHEERAQECFQKVIALENEISNKSLPAYAYCELGLLIEETGGNIDESMRLYDCALKCGFDDADLKATIQYNRARVFTDIKKDLTPAIQVCEEVLELDVEKTSLLTDLYLLLLKSYILRGQPGDLQAALDHARLAIELDLESENAFKITVASAELNSLAGNQSRAGEYFYEAATIEGQETNTQVTYLLKSAACFAQAEEFVQAVESCKKADALNSNTLVKVKILAALGQIYNNWAAKTEDAQEQDKLSEMAKQFLQEGLMLTQAATSKSDNV